MLFTCFFHAAQRYCGSVGFFSTSTRSWMGSRQHQLLTWKRGSDPASWPGQSGGNPSVCVTHGALFSQHGSAVYAPDILPVNDLVSSD